MTLKPEDMLRLEALDAVVPRGWTPGAGFEQSERGNYIADEGGRIVVAEQDDTDCVLETTTRDLMVEMRNALPGLLGRLKAAEAERDALRSAILDACNEISETEPPEDADGAWYVSGLEGAVDHMRQNSRRLMEERDRLRKDWDNALHAATSTMHSELRAALQELALLRSQGAAATPQAHEGPAPVQLLVTRDITADEMETLRKLLAEHRQNPGPVSLTPILALVTREEHERVLAAIDADLAGLEPNDNGEGACCDPNAVLEVVCGVRRLIQDTRR